MFGFYVHFLWSSGVDRTVAEIIAAILCLPVALPLLGTALGRLPWRTLPKGYYAFLMAFAVPGAVVVNYMPFYLLYMGIGSIGVAFSVRGLILRMRCSNGIVNESKLGFRFDLIYVGIVLIGFTLTASTRRSEVTRTTIDNLRRVRSVI